MIVKYENESSIQRYKLMGSSVIPRPIAWISTYNKDGSINLAPFSYFTPLSSDPAVLIISIGHKKDNELKDTLKNLQENKKCTICIAKTENLDDLHQSSKNFEYGESESNILGIEMESIIDNFPPIVKGIPTAFFCEFHSIVALGGKTIPTIVEIKEQYIDDSLVVIQNELIDIHFKPLARVSTQYSSMGQSLKAPIIK